MLFICAYECLGYYWIKMDYNRAGSVSVFGVGIGIRYFRLFFLCRFGIIIDILKYLGIRYRYLYFWKLVENRNF